MKTKILSMFAMAAMLLTTSCAKDEANEPASGEQVTASFNVQLPTGINARQAKGPKKVYADGTTATKLKYMVFDASGNRVAGVGGETAINLTTTVQLQLTTGKEYQIVFWAANANAPYSLDETGKVTINYDGMKANDESLDAFYRCYKYKAGADVENPIKLYRPFAQLNVGTKDLAEAEKTGFNKAAAKTKVTVSGIGNELNLLTGAVSGDATVTCDLNAIPTGETFPKEGYDYLSMDYLLVGKESKTNVDVDWEITDGANTIDRTFANVPLQGNYRTNIYGSLLTSTSDFNVEIDPAFKEPANEYASTADDLKNAFAAGNDVKLSLTEDITIEGTADKAINLNAGGEKAQSVELNLNGKTLTLTNASINAIKNGVVKVSNGKIKSTEAKYNVLQAYEGGSISLDNVEIDAPKVLTVVYVENEGSSVYAKNSKIYGTAYGVGTNASMPAALTNKPVMTFEGCEVHAQTPFFVNVPGEITLKQTKAYGYWQGLVLRGGTANVEDCEIYQAYDAKYDDDNRAAADAADQYINSTWGGGNNLPLAAIVLGDGSKAGSVAYNYPTNITMKGTKVVGNKPFRAIVQKNRDKNVVTFTDGGGNTITGEWVK